ncbi:hypothetical protein F2P81_008222 [Scophthalmus maximus]|uniref:Uncharacterized protein n=1 Tax=Scophthalmus maximus TaxID=52904 RepID=A0A6A4T1P8_SCOMX|nr:hypothetical protein F2P81_008222 [Scophthalmus maximus]
MAAACQAITQASERAVTANCLRHGSSPFLSDHWVAEDECVFQSYWAKGSDSLPLQLHSPWLLCVTDRLSAVSFERDCRHREWQTSQLIILDTNEYDSNRLRNNDEADRRRFVFMSHCARGCTVYRSIGQKISHHVTWALTT